MAELIQTLLSFSERAGEIARRIRQEPKLFSLLVEEKSEGEKNQRFDHDFKTLADVLIQEALRHHVTQMIPSLGAHVHGEESAEFTNTLGEKITVKICDTQQETALLLEKVLNGNKEAAEILSAVVHSDISLKVEPDLMAQIPKLPVHNLGIWIDPIDSTGEYVKGKNGICEGKVYKDGLPCVTVLIGLYNRSTGLPLGGLVNQPFSVLDEESNTWSGRAYWGVSHGSVSIQNVNTSLSCAPSLKPIVVLSVSEDARLQEALKTKFTVCHVTGAGYKLLVVAQGLAAAYVCSKGSTFRWDTNAPHGILRAQGGGVVVYKQLLKYIDQQISEEVLHEHQVKYNNPNNTEQPGLQWSNAEGFIAYRSSTVIPTILECIKTLS